MDALRAIQEDLEDTQMVMSRSVSALLKRGEKLREIQGKSQDLNCQARELRIRTSRCPPFARLVENLEEFLNWLDNLIRTVVEGNDV